MSGLLESFRGEKEVLERQAWTFYGVEARLECALTLEVVMAMMP